MLIKTADPGALHCYSIGGYDWMSVSFSLTSLPLLLKCRVLDSLHLQNRKLKRRVRPKEGDLFQGHLKEPTIVIKLSGKVEVHFSWQCTQVTRGAADAHSHLTHTNVNNAAQPFVWVKRFCDANWWLTPFFLLFWPCLSLLLVVAVLSL